MEFSGMPGVAGTELLNLSCWSPFAADAYLLMPFFCIVTQIC